MSIPTETIRQSLASMLDEELIRRWNSQTFSDEARELARFEIERRGIDASLNAVDKLDQADIDRYRLLRSKRFRGWVSALMIAAFAGGFLQHGALPVMVGGLLGAMFGLWLGAWLDVRVHSTAGRMSLVILVFVLTLCVSVGIGLGVSTI